MIHIPTSARSVRQRASTEMESDRIGSLRDLVRRIQSWIFGDRASMFAGARNIDISNGTFIVTQTAQILPGPPLSTTTHPATAGQSASANTSTPSTAHRDPSGPLRKSSKVYVDCLLPKGRGYPLWIPSPKISLPLSIRERGVSVGDVGVLTSDGGFDVLFSIFYDATHPINAAVARTVPDAFVRFTPAPTDADTEHFVELNASAFLTDPSTFAVDNGGQRSTFNFEATGTEGAVLMIPEDMHAIKLKITDLLREYVKENIVMWYKYFRHTLGHDIKNGDLRVVYGCRKSTGFGIAAAFNTGRRENTRLSFFSTSPYLWTHTGSAEAKTASSAQSTTESPFPEPVRNQCLFIETIDVKLSAETWTLAELDTVKYIVPSSTPREPKHAKQGSGKSSAEESGSTSVSSLGPSHEHAFHPSVILHYILESINSNAAYMVCNDDWAPFISENTLNAPEFINQILENRVVIEHQGMLSFRAISDADALGDFRQRGGALIRFNRLDNASSIEHSHWKAERRMFNRSRTAVATSANYSATSGGHPLPTPSANTWTEPPWCGWIETTGDALLILEAARRGLIPRVTRRLVDSERKMITSGSVFVFDEGESGIKRWTDGYFWSPSRILGNFLLFRETDKRGAGHRSTGAEQELTQQEAASSSAATRGLHIENQSLSRSKANSSGLTIDKQRERALIGSLTNSSKFKEDGLMKKTFSVTINGVAQHLISYYKIADVESGRLRSPSSLPELASLDISPEYLDKTHFRNPPKVEVGTDGVPRYRGECDDIEGNNSYQAGYSGPGAGDLASNMLGGPVQAGDPLLLNTDLINGPGNIATKRSRLEQYGSLPQQWRARRVTGASKPSSGSPGTGRSASPPDHQPHGIHQSPPSHQMSISPHLESSQQSQAGGTATYDAVAMQPQYPQQPQSIQQHIQRSQLTQQPQTAPYQQPQPAIYPPPPGAVGQQQPYSPYGNPYVHAPHSSYWSGPDMPSSVMAPASPMSTDSDSPNPS